MKRITLLALLSVPFCALAQTSDADIAQLIKDRKFVEAEKMTLARISSNSRDDMAIWFLASVVANDAAKRDKAIVVTEACVNVLPESAKCHHALGRLYGAAAMSSGLVN
ncbi:MAG: hypothetical protein LH481_10890, partial [Burkholderiales bacterium]|nr:hypothetical protein [Burkholderiales bacterium]